jgi:hypothetical protein
MVQLPGLNTPQFNWNLSKMPGHPMPVPPVFQPELPARAIAYLAEHPRRNMWVGVSTAYTILGERLAPKLLDWYLGRTGVKSQQTDQELPRLGSNVFEPRDQTEDQGAHGPFDDKAHAGDPQLWLSVHRRRVLATVAAAAAGAGAMPLWLRRHRSFSRPLSLYISCHDILVRYVLRVRTNVVIIVASALGYFFFTGGRVADRLLRRGHIRAWVLVPAVCLLALPAARGVTRSARPARWSAAEAVRPSWCPGLADTGTSLPGIVRAIAGSAARKRATKRGLNFPCPTSWIWSRSITRASAGCSLSSRTRVRPRRRGSGRSGRNLPGCWRRTSPRPERSAS